MNCGRFSVTFVILLEGGIAINHGGDCVGELHSGDRACCGARSNNGDGPLLRRASQEKRTCAGSANANQMIWAAAIPRTRRFPHGEVTLQKLGDLSTICQISRCQRLGGSSRGCSEFGEYEFPFGDKYRWRRLQAMSRSER